MELEENAIVKGNRHTYRIEKKLGQGGFGITYRASSREGRMVYLYAIKEHFIRDIFDRSADGSISFSRSASERVEESKRDFLHEARRLERLGEENNNIVKVEESFEYNNTAYYAMEYLDGDNLRSKVLHDGVLSEQAMLRLMKPVIAAVQYLHDNRMLHLDIKPDNIVLRLEDDGSETPVLIDFGVAMHFDNKGNATTSSHFVGGTKGYAPLEQAQGITSFTPLPDVYALGATMYFLLTGKDPAQADFDTASRVEEQLRYHGVDAATRQAIVHAMSPNPQERTPSAGQLLKELEGTVAPPTSPTETRSSRNRDNHAKDGFYSSQGKTTVRTTGDLRKQKRESGIVKPAKSLPKPGEGGAGIALRFWWKKMGLVLGLVVLAIVGLIALLNKSNEERAVEMAEVNTVSEFGDEIISVNGVDFKMVWVEGGTFTMGATREQRSVAFDDEMPMHSVTLSGYYIGETEVTQALWKAVMGSNPSFYWRGDNLPVEYVSWNEAQAFVQKLNALTDRTFRLPTEAEWEYAALGGSKNRGYKYAGSDDIGAVAWYYDNSGQIHPVGQKRANELGLYDMSGNVYEWCSDWFGDYSSDSQTNPKGPSSGSCRVIRGGSWSCSARGCRISSRNSDSHDDRSSNLGLRLVLVP